MTFDQLWRMNLADEKRRTDSASGNGTQPIDEESRTELELTYEDRAFPLQVGIKTLSCSGHLCLRRATEIRPHGETAEFASA